MNCASVVDDFVKIATRYPSSVAVVMEDSPEVKYAELLSLAREIQTLVYITIKNSAEGLHATDINTPLVCVMTDRSVAFIAAAIGTMLAGAAYVPVDPAFPPDRQTHIFSHSQCGLLIADEASYKAAGALGVPLPSLLLLDRAGRIISSTVTGLSVAAVAEPQSLLLSSEQRLAYVLYTSGSTGKPKGVMVRHLGVANTVHWFAEELAVGPNSRVLALTTFCFDISVLELFVPLTRGGAVVLAPVVCQRDPFRLLELVQRLRVTVLQATPTTYEMLLATGWSGDPMIDFLVGGEAFRPSLLPLARHCRSLRNVYGPTETTIWSTSYTVTAEWAARRTEGAVQVPVGGPISATDLYLVSETAPHALVLSGPDEGASVEGELWIGGQGVALGYLHAPELTSQRFLPNPFGEGYVYRTGDLFRRTVTDAGPEYVFVRRLDDQVKVGGHRIELPEIEAVFAQCEGVVQAVALVRGNGIVLYLRLAEPVFSPGARRVLLRRILAQGGRALTHYMMPRATVMVSSFPLTANGKLDRNALPDPSEGDFIEGDGEGDHDSDGRDSVHSQLGLLGGTAEDEKVSKTALNVAPALSAGIKASAAVSRLSPAETRLAQHICAAVAAVRGGSLPGLNASFAAIGVDSLGAVVLVRQLRQALGGLAVQPADVFAPGATAARLAQTLLPRLRNERPEAVLALGLDLPQAADPARDEWDIELAGLSADREEESPEQHAEDRFSGLFESTLAGARGSLEGLRGLFTFMVLWDHYSPLVNAPSWQSATGLFVLLSGFTTHLQLRTPLRLLSEASPRHGLDASKTQEEEEGHVLLGGSGEVGMSYQPREPFNWRAFLLSRAVGVFPILWIALLLALPTWLPIHQPHKRECAVLYVLAMQSWWRPDCAFAGPNIVVFASIIWNVFLLYALIRAIFTQLHDWGMRRWAGRPEGVLLTQAVLARPAGWFSWLLLPTQAGFVFALLVIERYFFYAKNAPAYLSYFYSGAATAQLLEGFLFASDWFTRCGIAERDLQLDPAYVCWHRVRPYLWFLPNSRSSPVPVSSAKSAAESAPGMGLLKRLKSDGADLILSLAGTPPHLLLWRFAPDLLAVCVGLQLSTTVGELSEYDVQVDVEQTYLPLTVIALIAVLVLQTGASRLNLTRLLLQSPGMALLGRCSFAIYLFQRMLLEEYLKYAVGAYYFAPPVDRNYWFPSLPLWLKFMAALALISFSYAVQRFIVDALSVLLYRRVLSRL